MTDTILVAGAGGFVGSTMVETLTKAGLPVRAGLRRTGPWRLDARNPESIARAMLGVGTIVNAVGGNAGTLRASTEHLCNAARLAGARLIQISSMAVYGAASGWVEEDAALDAAGSAYAQAKIDCEDIVRAHVAQGGEAVILRAGLVHGPGGDQWTARFCRLLRAGRAGDFGALGDGFCNLTFAPDLAAAVIAALRLERGRFIALNIASADPPRWNDMLVALGRAMGVAPVRRIASARLWAEAHILAPPLWLARRAAGRLRAAVPDPIPPSLMRLMAQQMRLSPARADAVLGLRRTPDLAALAQSAAWFREAA